MSLNYKSGDVLESEIQKIVPRGLGLAFAEGLTVFVPLSVPGDRVSIRLDQIKGKTAFGHIESVIGPSANRSEPACKYFGICGGCDFQQMNYEAQLAAKTGIIKDSLHRIGKIDLENEIAIIPSPKPLEYRTRAQWHLDTRNKKIGYFKRGTHEVIDVDHCPILDNVLDETLVELRSDLDWGAFWPEEAVIDAAVGSDENISLSSAELLDEPAEIMIDAFGEKYFFNAQSFFQGNSSLIDKLVDAAIGESEGGHALDLYCGVGLFSLPLARRFAHVTGVEGNEASVKFAERNARNAELDNLKFFNDGVAEFLSAREIGETDLVLLDPPRSGTEKSVIEAIIKLRPINISYVSCDPAILARDLRIFLDGGYRIEMITALDLFPQTHHVETVVRLNRS
ncbi:MAG: class I SAM-dependent RNA methyltransferase [Acidobacteria bacterium]|nr:class I SAM-dependent RNA methyltransferase [Acidobacteriota bacterium]